MAEDRKGFWHTLPGILTGIAGIITAIGGLLVVLQQIGVFDIAETTSPVDAPATVVATVVTAQDADPLQGRISAESPMGEALLGRKKGDKVQVETPDGATQYKILNIA